MNSDKKRPFKRELYEQFARIGKALACGARIELLDLLSQTERTVEDLADMTELSIANVSQHLQVLRRARMVQVRREGLYAYYRLTDESVFLLWQALRKVGQTHLTEIEQLVNSYIKDRDALEPVTAKELMRRLKEKNVFVLDVRPMDEYQAGHISGAKSIPVAELGKRLKELPRNKEIIAYCRGPYCVYADEAVTKLTKRGFKARRLAIGLPDWKVLGLPVSSGEAL